MPDLSLTEINDQINLICDSDRFRGSPQLAALLRALGDDLGRDDGDASASGQRGQRPARLPRELDPSQNPRIRVQATRLRQALADYYRGPGASDRLVIDLPRRSYRLRVTPRGRQAHVRHFRAVERATLLVIEVAGYGLDATRDWIPQAVSQQLLVEFGRFAGVHAVGPIRRGDVKTEEGMSLAISQPHPESFMLDVSIQADADHMVLTARLLDGATGVQIWSWSAPLGNGETTGLTAWAETAAVLARQLADETGVIAQEILRASAGKAVDQLTVHEAVAAVACRRGDLGAAREFAEETLDLCEEFPRFGEIMMRRFFPDRVVDTVARALEQLGLGWFHDPPVEPSS